MLKKPLLYLAVLAAFAAAPLYAQDNMQILREKIKADKKLVVSQNLSLTDAEAKRFWPVYERYQADLETINKRLLTGINRYAELYNKDRLDDAQAKGLVDEMLAIDDAESKLKRSYQGRLGEALPATKVMRYMQIENKIRAVVRFELADRIPLAPLAK